MYFTILGRTELRVGDRVIELGAAKQRALLALLLLNVGRPVLVDTLVQQLWEGRTHEEVRNALHQHVSRLRGALKGADVPHELKYESAAYRLELDPLLIDFHLFRKRAEAGRAAAHRGDHELARSLLSEAIGLWRGVALIDVRTDWAVQRRKQMEIGDLLPAYQALITTELELRDYADVLNRLGPLMDEYPMDEGFAKQWIQALDGLGRITEAMDFYARYRQRLVNELGAEPSAALQAAYRHVLRQRAPAESRPAVRDDSRGSVSGPPRLLPPQLSRGVGNFTGRQELLARLDALFDGSRIRQLAPVAALHGMPGVGKTALAIHWIRRNQARFSDGVLYANLNGYGLDAPVPAVAAMAAFLSEMGVPPDRIPIADDQRQLRLNRLLAGRTTLMFLDNVRDSAHARPLLQAAGSSCSVLLTSRGRLHGLAVRDGVELLAVPPMSVPESTALLRGEVAASRGAEDPDALRALVELSAGLPLALKIIGQQAAGRSHTDLSDLVVELDSHYHLMAVTAESDDEAATLSGVFAWSYDALPEPAARLFRMLGLHPGPDFGCDVAAALHGCDPDQAEQHLNALTQVHLLERAGRRRYRFHDLLHAYAAYRVVRDEPAEQRQAAVTRMADWYLRTATNARQRLMPPDSKVPPMPTSSSVTPVDFDSNDEALRWFDRERANLIAAARRAAADELHDHAWRILATVSDAFERSGFKDDFLEVLPIILESARTIGDPQGEIGMLVNLGRARFGRRDYRGSLEDFRSALDVAAETGDMRSRATIMHNIASAHLELRELDRALEIYGESLQLHRDLGLQVGEAYSLHRLADTYRRLGRYEQALTHYQEALRLRVEIGHLRGRGDTLTNLGALHHELGEHESALDYCQRALETHEQTRDEVKTAETLTTMAAVYVDMGSPVEAAACAVRAMDLGEAIQDPLRQARALHLLGLAKLNLQDKDGARQAWTRALQMCEALDEPMADEVRALLDSHATGRDCAPPSSARSKPHQQ